MEKNKQLRRFSKKAGILLMSITALCFLSGSPVKAYSGAIISYNPASVPELDSLHESIYVLWHNAYPNKDYALIKEVLPKLEVSVAKLAEAALPEILHSKQAKWDSEMILLQSNLSALQKAVAEDNKESMLETVELLHGSFERLVRTIRPKLAELERFHEDLYVVYHHYMPGNDIEKIQAIIPSMKTKIGQLKQARLPQKLADQQNKFDEAVSKMEVSLNELENSVKTDNKEQVRSAVEKLHSDYQRIDAIVQ